MTIRSYPKNLMVIKWVDIVVKKIKEYFLCLFNNTFSTSCNMINGLMILSLLIICFMKISIDKKHLMLKRWNAHNCISVLMIRNHIWYYNIYFYHHLSLNLQGDQNHGHFSNFGLLSSGHFANSEPKQFVFNGRTLL